MASRLRRLKVVTPCVAAGATLKSKLNAPGGVRRCVRQPGASQEEKAGCRKLAPLPWTSLTCRLAAPNHQQLRGTMQVIAERL